MLLGIAHEAGERRRGFGLQTWLTSCVPQGDGGCYRTLSLRVRRSNKGVYAIEGKLGMRMQSTGVLLKSGRNGIVVTSNRIQADPTACSQEGSVSTRQSRIGNWYETRGHKV